MYLLSIDTQNSNFTFKKQDKVCVVISGTRKSDYLVRFTDLTKLTCWKANCKQVLRGGKMKLLAEKLRLILAVASLLQLGNVALAFDSYNVTAQDVISVDLNGDTFRDMVATQNDSIVVLLNDGFGLFPTQVQYYVGGNQSASLVADYFDGDGNLDLIVTSRGNDLVSLLSGNGDGTFASPVTFVTLPEPGPIVSGDFDSQNGPDIAVISSDVITDSIYIHFNDGSGGFASVTKLAVDANPAELVAADLNGDLIDDLAICHWGTPWIGAGLAEHEIWIMIGNGDGTFQSPTYLNPIATVHNMVAGDFEGDGDIDLLIGSNDEDTPFSALTGWLNDGNGSFSPGGFGYFFGDAWPWKMALADLDGNGYADIPVAMWNSNPDIRIFALEPGGIIDSVKRTKPQLAIQALKVDELNGYGYPEMIVASGNSLAVYGNVTEDCCLKIRGNVNYDIDDMVDISDLTLMVDCLFGGSGGPCAICPAETDFDGSGLRDITDLTGLVDYLFGGGLPPAACLDLR